MYLSKIFEKNALFIKASFIALMAFITIFVDKHTPWTHWTWVLYFTLFIALLLLEYHDDKTKHMRPIDKAKKYLADYSGWICSGAENYEKHYNSAPEFTIKTNDQNTNLDFMQEWTRGEIGACYKTGNGAYYREIYFHGTLLHQIHVVLFDGGKKTVVAPNWEPIGQGRIYYYLEDSIEYAYQKHLAHQYKADYSKEIRKTGNTGNFNIPIFSNQEELRHFIDFCAEANSSRPATDEDIQNTLFFDAIEKYKNFKTQRK